VIDITNNRDERHRQAGSRSSNMQVNDVGDMTLGAMLHLAGFRLRAGGRRRRKGSLMTPTMEVREAELHEQVQAVPAPQPAAPAGPQLFADVLLESARFQKRRTWTTVVSFVVQCLVVAAVVIIPLMFTEALPKAQLLTFLIAPPPPPPPPPPPSQAVAKVVKTMESELLNGKLRTPSKIPEKVQMINEEAPAGPSTGEGVIGGVPGGVPGGQLGGVIGGIISSTSNLVVVPKLAPVVPKRVRISQGVTAGMLLRKVEPTYPTIAQQARIQGQVVLKAIIDKNGDIQNLEAESGHPLLIPAAIAAVKQWHYRPYLLNGLPVEVETTILVTFTLSH